MYIIENYYRNYRIFTFTIFETIFILDIFEYKSFEITFIRIGIPEYLIKVPVKVLPLLPIHYTGNLKCK